LNIDEVVTFEEYVKSSIQFYTEFEPNQVNGTIEGSYFSDELGYSQD